MLRMFSAALAVLIANQLLLVVELVFLSDIVLALAGLADESDDDCLFFFSHGAIIKN